ncbi:MAG: trzA [Candidatus Angelobacter sp.]|jgi:5-methylthioadenosine/S-adenosylhomocysteine deaminase|nr:trzA [Candidatus Angelobacter sp.]
MIVRRSSVVALSLTLVLVLVGGTVSRIAAAPAPVRPAVLLDGTVVTMNPARDVIENGHVLVRDGRIVAIWRGSKPPAGVSLDGVVRTSLGSHALIFPGLINLHDHPFYAMLPLWQPPSSHVQAALGRPTGTEPYANRNQWRGTTPEHARLISNPNTILTDGNALNRYLDVIKYDKVRMILGGTTTTQGWGPDAALDRLLARNAESPNFGRQRIGSSVFPLSLSASDVASLRGAMSAGLVDAWLAHLAEGVRDGDRRPGDPTSSRSEFADLKAKHLLNDTTVIIHGTGLEPEDFAAMASAPAARADGIGDGRGAKLVWSPLSNLLLYGKTTAVYDALNAGVLVSLGTDWTPSGSANLLAELKVADRALRDDAVLGLHRFLVPRVMAGQSDEAHGAGERALDQLLVEMVTINPATAIRWNDQVGSVEAGKVADLIVVNRSQTPLELGIPPSPYRGLIDATERDVQLVMVDGVPVAGDVSIMESLKPGHFEVVTSPAGCFDKAIDVTEPSIPGGTETLAHISASISNGMHAMGGDFPPAGGGPSSPYANTWSYLKANFLGTAGLPDSTFNFGLAFFFGLTPENKVNLEAMKPPPFFTVDDAWWLATLGAKRDATGLIEDVAPPYKPYLANTNHVSASDNPFAPETFEQRWYSTGCPVH